MAHIVVAYIVVAYTVVAYTVVAYTFMAYTVKAYRVVPCIARAYIVRGMCRYIGHTCKCIRLYRRI